MRHDTYPFINPLTHNQHSTHRTKNILITGAAKDLGRSIALSFAKAGASRIAIAARTPLEATTVCTEIAEAVKDAGHNPQTLRLVMDVCDRRNVEDTASTVRDA